MKRNGTPTEVLQVKIDKINHEGRGYAHYVHPPTRGSEGKHLHLNIPYALPGDIVQVTVPNASGRRKATLTYDRVVQAGPTRNLAIPEDEGLTGGTPLIYMHYKDQLAHKEQMVKSFLAEQGFNPDLVEPIVGMTQPDRYRNKMELTFGPDDTLGMHRQGNFRQVIDMKDSYLAPQVMVDIKNHIQAWQRHYQIPGYEKATRKGILRHLLMRHSIATDELMIVLYATVAPSQLAKEVEVLRQSLLEAFPNLKSFQWIENVSSIERIYADAKHVIEGRDYIMDRLNGFDYRIWPDTFFQANPVQAEKLVQIALEMAQPQADMRILDLYCGVGTFSLPLAHACQALAGIEIVESSILSARRNAADNQITNTSFFVNDAKNGLRTLKDDWDMPDLLLINPPRSGAGGKVMRAIGRFGTEKLVYVSCSPQSLAEDLATLRPYGYHIQRVVPVDQFPHTNHVEVVGLLVKS